MPSSSHRWKVLLGGVLLSQFAVAECVVVAGAPEYVPVSKELLLKVRLNGRPVPDAVVQVEQVGRPNSGAIFETAQNGEATISKLPEGKYNVGVLDGYGDAGYLYVQVRRHKPHQASVEVSLRPSSASRQMLPATRLARLAGEVDDPSGAPIPGASIVVTRLKPPGRGPLARVLQTDAKGKFETNLPAASYVVLFSSQGFVSKLAQVVLTPQGLGSLEVQLAIGSC